MTIRNTTYSDLDVVMKIYEKARQFMAQHGNPHQWGDTTWPPKALIEEDIKNQKSYVCLDANDNVVGVFFYDYGFDIEPTYRDIQDGNWRDETTFGVVHRLASVPSVKGVGTCCLNWAYEKSKHLKVDTHGDNIVMQNLLSKLGFEKKGIIYVVEDNYPRFAYEK